MSDILSICVCLIYPIFTEHIRAFSFYISAKTPKTDSLISKWSVYFRSFLLFWQERLLQIIWPRQHHWQWGRKRSGPCLSTMLSPCHGQCRSLYLFPMNSACLACSISIFYIQSGDSIQIPCGNLYTIQTTILVYFRFSKKYFHFVSFSDPVFVRLSYETLVFTVSFTGSLSNKDVCFLMQLLLLDTVVLIYDFHKSASFSNSLLPLYINMERILLPQYVKVRPSVSILSVLKSLNLRLRVALNCLDLSINSFNLSQHFLVAPSTC